MEGAVELAEEVFHVPVRLGVPVNVAGLKEVVNNPVHATGVGLLQYGGNTDFVTDNVMESEGWLHKFKKWFLGDY